MIPLLLGFAIALTVGLTGIGGGSFTVPALLLLFGLPAEAVGTAFVFAGILRLIAGMLALHWVAGAPIITMATGVQLAWSGARRLPSHQLGHFAAVHKNTWRLAGFKTVRDQIDCVGESRP